MILFHGVGFCKTLVKECIKELNGGRSVVLHKFDQKFLCYLAESDILFGVSGKTQEGV